MEFTKGGFYIIKDEFFELINEPFLKTNKGGNRPHYYCIRDDKHEDILWMIPLSSKVDKYQAIINRYKDHNRPCDTLFIAKLGNGKKSVFLIQDMFPITARYIDRSYTINGKPYILPVDSAIYRELEVKSRRTLNTLKSGRKLFATSPDVIKIMNDLLNDK